MPAETESAPHVRVRDDAIEIDGRPTFLFGGEVQYFRVRDPGFDGARTERLWSQRLDLLKAAGGNFVSTYVPWDYHEPEPGRFDFSGARDIARFLEIAAEKGFFVCVKPGPYILSEWPYGFGSYGAVPAWWVRRNPGELVRDRRGAIFRWHPLFPSLGPGRNALGSLASAKFLAATERWFAALHERIARLLGPGRPIVMLQLDNETNLFWQDIYEVDFHPAALARWRARLRARWGTPDALSDAYGRRYRSFDEVRPPRKGRGRPAAHRDWLDHQHELVGEWLGACRAAWDRLGVREPQVLFLTNDTHQTFPGRDLLLPCGPVKNRHGLHAIDAYPRAFPVPRSPSVIYDRPYEPDVVNRVVDVYNDLHVGPSRLTVGIEVQGGHLEIPLETPFGRFMLAPHEVTPESTLQTCLRFAAAGMKAIGIYTVCGGLNRDGTPYFLQASIRPDGTLHPRYEALKAIGRLIRAHERELLESRLVESRVGLLLSARARGTGYGHAGEQRIYGDELRACFGWLVAAGFSPRVLDVDLASEEDLALCRVLLFPTSGEFSEEGAAKLERWVERGGTLIQAIRPGPLARSLFPAEESRPRGGAFRLRRPWRRATFALEGLRVTAGVPLGADVPRWAQPPGATPVAWVDGEEPRVLAYSRRVGPGAGRAIFASVLPTALFATSRLYRAGAKSIEKRALLARRLCRLGGERRLFAFDSVREEAFARVVPSTGAVFLFVFSLHDEGETVIRVRDLEALGLRAEGRYRAEEVLVDPPHALGTWSGAALRDEGLRLILPARASAVVRVGPAA